MIAYTQSWRMLGSAPPRKAHAAGWRHVEQIAHHPHGGDRPEWLNGIFPTDAPSDAHEQRQHAMEPLGALAVWPLLPAGDIPGPVELLGCEQ